MENSFNLSDLGIKTFTYAQYCATLEKSDILNNPVISDSAASYWVCQYKRKFVSPEMVHEAMLQVNLELYTLKGKIVIADNSHRDAVARVINETLRRTPKYMAELKQWSIDKRRRTATVQPKISLNVLRGDKSGVKDLSSRLLQTTSLNCVSENSLSLSRNRRSRCLISLLDLDIQEN